MEFHPSGSPVKEPGVVGQTTLCAREEEAGRWGCCWDRVDSEDTVLPQGPGGVEPGAEVLLGFRRGSLGPEEQEEMVGLLLSGNLSAGVPSHLGLGAPSLQRAWKMATAVP